MILPLLAGAWLLLLWLAGGLCAAARLGDSGVAESDAEGELGSASSSLAA
jgi:hypothetical protein